MTKMNFAGIMIITAAALFIINGPAFAQRGPDSLRTERHVAMLKDRLSLNDKQVHQIRDILKEEQQTAMKERESYKGDRQVVRKAREERRKATDEKIRATLTDNQKKEFDRIKDEIRPEPKKRPSEKRRSKDQKGSGMKMGD